MTITTHFSTQEYRKVHGKAPRANQRGCWMFQDVSGPVAGDTVVVPGSKSLTEAKRWVCTMVAEQGESKGSVRNFKVCP